MLQSVMVIDDDEVDQYIAQRAFKKWGFSGTLFQEQDGESAIGFLKNYKNNEADLGKDFPPTLILLDINMPRMNGFEFLEEFHKLRSQNGSYDTSVIMMFSSSERPEDKERAMKYDFVSNYITKPLTQENIQIIMESLTQTIAKQSE